MSLLSRRSSITAWARPSLWTCTLLLITFHVYRWWDSFLNNVYSSGILTWKTSKTRHDIATMKGLSIHVIMLFQGPRVFSCNGYHRVLCDKVDSKYKLYYFTRGGQCWNTNLFGASRSLHLVIKGAIWGLCSWQGEAHSRNIFFSRVSFDILYIEK